MFTTSIYGHIPNPEILLHPKKITSGADKQQNPVDFSLEIVPRALPEPTQQIQIRFLLQNYGKEKILVDYQNFQTLF